MTDELSKLSRCRIYKGIIANTAEICPHCGVKTPDRIRYSKKEDNI